MIEQYAPARIAITAAADIVGLTIAEFFPRQVMHLQQLLQCFPLISPDRNRDLS